MAIDLASKAEFWVAIGGGGNQRGLPGDANITLSEQTCQRGVLCCYKWRGATKVGGQGAGISHLVSRNFKAVFCVVIEGGGHRRGRPGEHLVSTNVKSRYMCGYRVSGGHRMVEGVRGKNNLDVLQPVDTSCSCY